MSGQPMLPIAAPHLIRTNRGLQMFPPVDPAQVELSVHIPERTQEAYRIPEVSNPMHRQLALAPRVRAMIEAECSIWERMFVIRQDRVKLMLAEAHSGVRIRDAENKIRVWWGLGDVFRLNVNGPIPETMLTALLGKPLSALVDLSGLVVRPHTAMVDLENQDDGGRGRAIVCIHVADALEPVRMLEVT